MENEKYTITISRFPFLSRNVASKSISVGRVDILTILLFQNLDKNSPIAFLPTSLSIGDRHIPYSRSIARTLFVFTSRYIGVARKTYKLVVD